MKKLIFTLFMSLMTFTSHAQNILLGDVNRDGRVSVTDAMMVVNIIMHGYDAFSVEPTSVSMSLGGTATLEISGGYNEYEVTSADTYVVEVSLEGTIITLTAVGSGETMVNVKDVQTMRILEIPVTVEYVPTPSYKTCPDNHHPHLIDLGLPSGTKWACCNMDTDHPENQSPTNYGSFYAWGETEVKDNYEWITYIHSDGAYNTCHNLGSDIAGSENDVAHVKWKGEWKMPTYDQINELYNNCNYEWKVVNGVYGVQFTGSNGGRVFLPASGYRQGGSLYGQDINGYYWSSTQLPSSMNYAYGLYFRSDYVNYTNSSRYTGNTVRPVIKH